MKRNKGRIYVATQNFTTKIDGQEVTVRAGLDRIREGHPIMAGREHLFEEMEVQYDVEQMTAAPGEKRG